MIKVGQIYKQAFGSRQFLITRLNSEFVYYRTTFNDSAVRGIEAAWNLVLFENAIRSNNLILKSEPAEAAVNVSCKHEFKSYVGLLEQFDYCIHCDVKQKDKGAA